MFRLRIPVDLVTDELHKVLGLPEEDAAAWIDLGNVATEDGFIVVATGDTMDEFLAIHEKVKPLIPEFGKYLDGGFTNDEIRANASQLTVRMVEGKIAPRYEVDEDHLLITGVTVTEGGTEGNLPLVDIVMTDSFGKRHYAMITGRIVNMISAAVKGANLRNHGVQEP